LRRRDKTQTNKHEATKPYTYKTYYTYIYNII